MTSPETAVPADAPRSSAARRRALLAVTAVVAIAGIAYGIYWALVLNHFESTDNAYVQGNIVQLTPQVSGTVVAIDADDTDRVKAGQVLVRLDPADAQVALDQAEAQLAQTVREVRTLYANNSTLKSQIALRDADLKRARSEQSRAQDDVDRRAPLLASGAVGEEEFKHSTAALAVAKSGVVAAQSSVLAAREQLSSNQTLTDGIAVDQHPNVLRAAARVREAHLALTRTDLRAPIDGFVAKRTVQIGERVQAGAPLLSLIALDRVWVDANFKESQLNTLRIGQPVTLTADVYGSTVAFHGAIDGLGAGTGAAFALLPAQNATGNWIKVVQRIPVRIRLDPKELAEHPLRVGLSMQVRVDVSRADGPALSDASSKSRTRVMQGDGSAAQARVRHIIEANGAGGVAHERARGMPSKAIAPAVAPDEAIAAATLAGAASTQPAARLK